MNWDDSKAGWHFLFGFDGETPSEWIRHSIVERELLGVVLFSRNFHDVKSLRKLTDVLRSLRSDLIIAIDQEGGEKSRITAKGFTHPSNRYMAEHFTAERIAIYYSTTATALRSAGINMNLAPVVDIGKQGSYIYERSFSDHPATVAKLSSAAIDGIQSGGVLACAKHFIGLGSSVADPHSGLTALNGDINEHLLPFIAASDAYVDAIMTTHIVVHGKAVTISSDAVKIIRKQLHFNGVVMSDDLMMGGALKLGAADDVALKALIAGHDVVLICSGEDEQIRAIKRVDAAISDGSMPIRKHIDSLSRIAKMKERARKLAL